MGELRDVFVEDLDDSTTGIKGRMAAIDSLLAIHDPKLHGVLQELGVDPTFYTLRWITTLLSREFDLPGKGGGLSLLMLY
jgi:TBC1 domain family member 13